MLSIDGCPCVCPSHAGIVSKRLNPSFHPSGSFLTPCAGTQFQGEPHHSPKLPKWACIGNFKPNIKIAISRKILTRSTCKFRKLLGPSNASHEWSAMTSYQIQDGGWPPFSKLKMRSNLTSDSLIFTKFCLMMKMQAQI